MTRKNQQRTTNEPAGPNRRVNGSDDRKPVGANGSGKAANGQGPASMEGGGTAMHSMPAATVDAIGAFDARTAHSSAACSNHDAYAGAAPLPPNGAIVLTAERESSQKEEPMPVWPGGDPLPASPSDFVEEIHRRIDLFEVWHSLLKSKDEKIRQRAVERLTDLRYKGAAAAEEPQHLIIDMPGPKRD